MALGSDCWNDYQNGDSWLGDRWLVMAEILEINLLV